MLYTYRKDTGRVHVLRIKGRLVCDDSAEDHFRDAINNALEEMDVNNVLIVNLENLTDLDSSGMGLLVWANNEANTLDKRAIYTNLDERWKEHLRVRQILPLLNFESEESTLLEELGEVADGTGDYHGSLPDSN